MTAAANTPDPRKTEDYSQPKIGQIVKDAQGKELELIAITDDGYQIYKYKAYPFQEIVCKQEMQNSNIVLVQLTAEQLRAREDQLRQSEIQTEENEWHKKRDQNYRNRSMLIGGIAAIEALAIADLFVIKSGITAGITSGIAAVVHLSGAAIFTVLTNIVLPAALFLTATCGLAFLICKLISMPLPKLSIPRINIRTGNKKEKVSRPKKGTGQRLPDGTIDAEYWDIDTPKPA